MATATKTPAKRAASQTSATAAVKTTRMRNGITTGSTTRLSSIAATAAGKGSGTAARNGPGKGAVKRALNGASHQPRKVAKPVRKSHVKGNGALPAELAADDDVQELARDALHDGEVVRKTRASTA